MRGTLRGDGTRCLQITREPKMTDNAAPELPWLKLGLGLTFLTVGILIAWRTGAFEFVSLENLDRLNVWFNGLGFWAPVVFVVFWIVASIFFLPGLPITIAGGLVFGAVWGTVWTTVGANLGAAAAFLVGRYLARGIVERRVESSENLQRIDAGVRRQGWRVLLITRLVPVFPFNIQNYVYGLTDIKLSTFVLVSLPAMLPATTAVNFAAGSVRTDDLGMTFWYLGIAAVFFVLLSFVPSWVVAKFGGTELQSQD
jgi:uncharacterized membrane protein YdjX (TVP38/TMEM64 family)